MPNPDLPSPEAALELLLAGNQRFRDGQATHTPRTWSAEISIAAQRPFAIVLGCSDSRTPVEILFDQGFGDLFVVRVAGNIVAPSVVGSIEFAAEQFGSQLVLVMGHTRCGAVGATVDALETGRVHDSWNVQDITDRIAPHVEDLVHGAPRPVDREALVRSAVRANVRASVDHLRHGSRTLEKLVMSGQLAVVGAEYELETGVVRVFDQGTRRPRPIE